MQGRKIYQEKLFMSFQLSEHIPKDIYLILVIIKMNAKDLLIIPKEIIILCITEPNQTLQTLAKPQKVYLENTNIINSLAFQNINTGNVRETFFANQLRTKHKVNTVKNGDFTIDENIIFEVGGKNKSNSQIKNVENAYIAADDIETGFENKIPLWLFGFLY